MPVFSVLAGDAQADAADDALELQWKMFQQQREDWSPWMEAGEKALAAVQEKIEAGPGDYTQTPGYQARYDTGLRSLQAAHAANGSLGSGAHDKDLVRFGQDYATQEYDNNLRRYYESMNPDFTLSGFGQNAAQATSNAAQNYSNNASSTLQQKGDARASMFGNIGNNLFKGAGWALGQL